MNNRIKHLTGLIKDNGDRATLIMLNLRVFHQMYPMHYVLVNLMPRKKLNDPRRQNLLVNLKNICEPYQDYFNTTTISW